MNFHGKKKALTFSYDDGVTQDIRLIGILDKYGLKATFNINSSLLGLEGCLKVQGKTVRHDKILPSEVKAAYKNHEVAAHTLTHPFLPDLKDEAVAYQAEEDRRALERLSGKKVFGMAYPCGGENNDDRVAAVLAAKTEIKYARTITSTHGFALQQNLLRFHPTVCHAETETMFALARRFLELKPDTPQIFYIWGHSYELDALKQIDWKVFEDFCRLVSGKDDIFYGTNGEILL